MIDAVWELRGPDGLSSDILVEVKVNLVEPRLVSSVASQLKALANSRHEQAGVTTTGMLVSTYLEPPGEGAPSGSRDKLRRLNRQHQIHR